MRMKVLSCATIALIILGFTQTIWAKKEAAEAGKEGLGGLEFSGLLEEEFGYVRVEGENESDFTLATVGLCADVCLVPNVEGHVLFLYEQGENEDNIAVDEAMIGFKLPNISPIELSLSLGRMYVPFGEFSSHFIADPFTLDVGETNEVAFQLSAAHEVAEVAAALYNDAVSVEGSNNTQIADVAARIGASAPEGALGKDVSLSLGASFITNILGSDAFGDMIEGDEVSERVPGIGGFISVNAMGAFVESEFILALNDAELSDGEPLKPRAFNMELGYSLPKLSVEIAGKFEQLSENSDSSTNRFGGVVSFGLFSEVASLSVEFLQTDDGDAAERSITGQLSAEF
jgi:hypothetical protein